MRRLSISSWSLHQSLGKRWHEPLRGDAELKAPGAQISLLELPAEIVEHGIHTLEVCHFHFPTVDEGYLDEFGAAVKSAGVELYSILIDTGDITHPDAPKREADLAFTRRWIDIATRIGTRCARVSAGDAEPDAEGEAVKLSAHNFSELVRYGRERGVQIITENWRRLTRRPGPLLEILDRCEGQIGLCADFGNFPGETKYEDLAAVLPRATSLHVKARYAGPMQMDREEFRRSMDMVKDAGFDGPISLIFDTGWDAEWPHLDALRDEAEPYVTL